MEIAQERSLQLIRFWKVSLGNMEFVLKQRNWYKFPWKGYAMQIKSFILSPGSEKKAMVTFMVFW